ncbi:4Fe-4S binding protein [Bittarella sp. HCP28S3_D9]|uniref:4Fe-4S binding protein n=1 Tax=Bittarella sp. HCP28S3_D9 TaxID=3440253 RepID=UPI003F8B4AE7
MKIKSAQLIYFSAAGTTERTARLIGEGLTLPTQGRNLLRQPLTEEWALSADCLAVVCVPVYAGRVPALCAESLRRLKGEGGPALAVAVYGNRDFDDCLVELSDLLEAGGFHTVGAAAAVAQHSIFPTVGQGRPDGEDAAFLARFAAEGKAAAEALDPAAPLALHLPGGRPYREAGSVPLHPSGDRRCTGCGACAAVCPAGAIDPAAPKKTDGERCISCAACIAVCPTGARAFRGPAYRLARKGFEKKCAARREPVAFFG